MKTNILNHAIDSTPALIALATFFIAYIFVILEEFTQLRKSKPIVVAAGIIWILVAMIGAQKGQSELVNTALRHNLMDYAELLLFIIVAITYINVLADRKVFDALRAWLIQRQFSYRKLFWITGFLAFFISGLADNLTTALAFSAVIVAVGKDNPRFTAIACINLVVAANAGGVFSPFGDITTLMVWQADILSFTQFFKLFLPSLINFLVPAFFMHFAIPKASPPAIKEDTRLTIGAKRVIALFLLTIITTVCLQQFFHLPPAIGMMLGLSYLQLFAYYTKLTDHVETIEFFPAIKELDWDTLLFFYGVILAIGGLATVGYLEIISDLLYSDWHSALTTADQLTFANIFIGLLSAIVDNIPLMFAIITIHPEMSQGQWLLLTLTTGVGGSLLAIGSAAGVGVMGQTRGIYTFFTHLKWIWAIALGYAASIACHLWWNAASFAL